MELITLNIWAGHLRERLIKFFHQYKNVDFFCLQEIYSQASAKIGPGSQYVNLDSFGELQKLLPNHRGYFDPAAKNIFGLCIFVSKEIEVEGQGKLFVYDNPKYDGKDADHSRIIQYVICKKNGKEFAIINFHGLRTSSGKDDTPERIAQSQKIKQFMSSLSMPKILCGDFNLNPDTKSFQILSENMVDHIKLNNITSTRTSYYPKTARYADYILTSPAAKVEEFKKLPEEASDHNALYVKFCIE